MRLLILACAVFSGLDSLAYTLKSANSGDSSYSSSRLSLSHTNLKPDGADWSYWKVAFGRSLTKAQSSTESDLISTSFNGILDFLATEDLTLGLTLDSSATKENGYQNQGSSLHFGYVFKSKEKKEEKTEIEEAPEIHAWQSSFGVDLYLGRAAIKQDFVVSIGAFDFYRTGKLNQQYINLALNWNVAEWLNLNLAGQANTYDQSKEDLQRVSGSVFLNNRAGPLVSTVAGLEKSNSSLGASFYYENWSFNVSGSRSVILVDDSVTINRDLTVGYSFDSGFDLEIGSSNSKTTTSETNLFLMDVAYSF